MRYFPASDLGHQSLEEMFSLPESHDPTKDLYTYLKGYLQTLQATDGAEQKSQLPIQAEIYRQLVPRAKYPKNWSQKDIDRFDDYWETDIKVLSVTPKHTGASWVNLAKPVTPGDDQGKNFNPTLLSFSQKIYDAEMTRRESINTRCGALLSTAGILGTLVVAAGQLGLIQQSSSHKPLAWIVYALFVVSLVYVLRSIIIGLQVQGGIQGEVIDADDLHPDKPSQPLDQYNCNIAKTTCCTVTLIGASTINSRITCTRRNSTYATA